MIKFELIKDIDGIPLLGIFDTIKECNVCVELSDVFSNEYSGMKLEMALNAAFHQLDKMK